MVIVVRIVLPVLKMVYYCLVHSVTNGKYGIVIATPNMKIGEPYFHRSNRKIGLAEVEAIADKKSILLLLNEKEKLDNQKCKTVSTQCSSICITSSTQCAVEYSNVSTQWDEASSVSSTKCAVEYSNASTQCDETMFVSSTQCAIENSQASSLYEENSSVTSFQEFFPPYKAVESRKENPNHVSLDENHLYCDDYIARNSHEDSLLCDVENTLKYINLEMNRNDESSQWMLSESLRQTPPIEESSEIIQINNMDNNIEYEKTNEENSEIIIEINNMDNSEYERTNEMVSKIITKDDVERNKPYKEKKFHWCYICKKKIMKFSRHMEDMHSETEEVKNFLHLPKGGALRKSIIAKLRSYSDFQYNVQVGYATNNLIVSRRTKLPKNAENFLPCSECKLMCEKTFLWAHSKKCKNTKVGSKTVQSEAKCIKILNTVPQMNIRHQFFPKVLSTFSEDDISDLIKKDETILNFGNFLCYVHCMKVNCIQIVRSKMRLLGRILREIQTLDPSVKNARDIFIPKNFPLVLTIGRKLGQFNNDTTTFVHPSVAMEVELILRKCAGVLENECLINNDEGLGKQIDIFLRLLDANYGPLIKRQALLAAKEAKFNKPEELPQIEDISKLMEFMEKLANDSYNDLKTSTSVNTKAFENLNKSVMTSVLLFNRKRTGETEKLLLHSYRNKQIVQHDSDLYRTLTEKEKIISSCFYRIEIRGKRDRKVPILFTKQMVQYVDTIIKFRASVGIEESNPYLFANCSAVKRFDACRAIRDLSELCGAKNPENLRGTKLRKQFATLMQVLKLTDNDTQILADFMGHHVDVHKSHYRKPDLALQTGMVSKLLLAATDTNLEKYRGQNLETLAVSQDLLEKTNPAVERRVDTVTREPLTEDCCTVACESPVLFLPNKIDEYCTDKDPDFRITVEPDLPRFRKRKQQFDGEGCSSDPDFKISIQPDSDSDISEYSTSRKRKRQCVRGPIMRRTWQSPEKKILRTEFSHYLKNRTLPSLKECIKVRSSFTELESRTSVQIKAWINNENNRKKSTRCK